MIPMIHRMMNAPTKRPNVPLKRRLALERSGKVSRPPQSGTLGPISSLRRQQFEMQGRLFQ